MNPAPGGPVWLHGASVGDIRALGPLIDALRAARPEIPLHLSATTATGRAVATRLYADLPITAPPLALPGRALARVQPRLVVLEYLELWPQWIAACARRGVPVGVVDGHVTHRSLRVAPLLRKCAGRLAFFAAQSEVDAEGARALGVPPERVIVAGNGKHDASLDPPRPDPALSAAIGEVQVVVGSLHPDEEAEALPALAASGLTALIAPRYPKRTEALVQAAQRLGVSVRRRSAGPGAPTRWIVLDTVGELAAAYACGRVAVVGGTFGRRDGQNLVEPARHGRPVLHGPRIANVRVEAEALDGRGARGVPDWTAAFAEARALATGAVEWPDPRTALTRLRGATARHLALILPIIDAATWTPRAGTARFPAHPDEEVE